MSDTPAATPPDAPGAPAPATPPVDAPAPTEPGVGDPAPDDDAFTSDRQKRRFSELVGRVGMRERERDEARARVEQLLEREVLRVAAATLSEPHDVFLDGATVADLLTEDGSDIDAQKVMAAVDAVIAKRPGLGRQAQPQPLPGGHRQPPAPARPTFAEVVHDLVKGKI
jgi:hypothetical protein